MTPFNPYPGLRPFRIDEDHLFFGREEQVRNLIARLDRNRFVAVRHIGERQIISGSLWSSK